MPTLTSRVQKWKDMGHNEDFKGHKVHCFYRHKGATHETPLLVFIHGFPTSSYDWIKIIDKFPTFSMLTFDFLGFGLSDKPSNLNYTLSNHADLAVELVERHVTKENIRPPVYIIAHDMGTSICSEILARDLDGSLSKNIQIIGVLLFNGNMIMSKASLVLGQRILRSRLGWLLSYLSNKPFFLWQLSTAASNKPLNPEEGDDQWNLLNFNAGNKRLHKTIQYTFERVEKEDRLLGAIRNSPIPISFAWGMEDQVATAALQLQGWMELRPSAPIYELPGLGHFPQLDDPESFTHVLKSILQQI